MIPNEWFERAQDRIRPYTKRTPLTQDAHLGLFLKWENQQVTGSFKPRGALNKILALEDWERAAGLVAASAGNHGLGVALAGQLTGTRVEIFVPENAVPSKVEGIRALGGELHFVKGGYQESETAAKAYARDQSRTFVSPYNDGQVIAGQGTVALEVLQQLHDEFQTDAEEIAAWVIPVGGGGLISACAAACARAPRPRPDEEGRPSKFMGVQPAASAFTHSLFHRHTQQGVHDGPTLADGLSGAIDADSITIPMMRELVADIVTVSEPAIEQAIAFAWRSYGEKIEGSAAAALAAVLDGIAVRPCVVVLTGGNIEPEVFERIIAGHPVEEKL